MTKINGSIRKADAAGPRGGVHLTNGFPHQLTRLGTGKYRPEWQAQQGRIDRFVVCQVGWVKIRDSNIVQIRIGLTYLFYLGFFHSQFLFFPAARAHRNLFYSIEHI
jgi:hypothetical protein